MSWSVDRSVGQLIGWSVGLLIGDLSLVNRSVGRSDSRLLGRSILAFIFLEGAAKVEHLVLFLCLNRYFLFLFSIFFKNKQRKFLLSLVRIGSGGLGLLAFKARQKSLAKISGENFFFLFLKRFKKK